MNYIKAIGIFLFVSLITSCNDKVTIAENRGGPEKVEINKELTDSAIEAFINEMIKKEHFKGVVLTAADNKVIHAKGYGMANDTMKNSINTKFHVASITKQFTAAAIMQLVEQNKVNLEASINNYLPTQYRSDKWNTINVHHLLSHTSGIEDYAVTRDYYNVVKGFCLGNTVDGIIKEAMSKELEFWPGSQFNYSNIGYTLLGEIIQNVTGVSYDRYLKTNVFEPLEMHSSFIHTTDYEASHDEAIGYRWDDEQNIHVLDDIVSLPVTEPDGNLVTTLNDFLKWTNIYVEKDQPILQEESLRKMTTPYIQADEEGPYGNIDGYGYGLYVSEDLISHTGYIVGFRSHFILNPEKNIRIVVFSNNVSMSPKDVSSGIYRIISDEKSD